MQQLQKAMDNMRAGSSDTDLKQKSLKGKRCPQRQPRNTQTRAFLTQRAQLIAQRKTHPHIIHIEAIEKTYRPGRPICGNLFFPLSAIGMLYFHALDHEGAVIAYQKSLTALGHTPPTFIDDAAVINESTRGDPYNFTIQLSPHGVLSQGIVDISTPSEAMASSNSVRSLVSLPKFP
eukprot:gene3851-4448_t